MPDEGGTAQIPHRHPVTERSSRAMRTLYRAVKVVKNDPKARVNPKALTELDGSNLCSYQPVQRFGIDRVGTSKESGISLKSAKKAPEHEAAQTNLLSLLSVQILRPVLITSVLKVPFC